MGQYIRIECRRFFHRLPGFFLSLLTVVLFAVLLLLMARYFLPEVLTVTPFQVGICIEGDDLMENYVNQYIQQMESAKGLMEFREIKVQAITKEQEQTSLEGRQISREKVRVLLEEQELAACIVIPERTAESIMDGTNIPVQVILRPGMAHTERYLQERLLTLLVECGAVMIDVPQAETLLLYEMQVEDAAEIGQILDLFHFGLVLDREGWFKTETVSAFGSVDLEEYYLAAGLTLLLLFWGLGCGSFSGRRGDKMPLLLERRGVMLPCQQGVRQGVYILWYLVPLVVLLCLSFLRRGSGVGGIGTIDITAGNTGATIASGVLCMAMLALQCSFFFEAAPTTAGGILLNVVWGLAGFFGAGGVLPSVFLPGIVTEICGRLPVGICMEWLMRGMAGNRGTIGEMAGMCLFWCLFFGAAGQLAFGGSQRKYR